MANSKIKTKVHVRVLLEICVPDTWSEDCPLSQVYKQAKDSAKNIIYQTISSSLKDIKIIGEAKAEAILIEE